MAYKPSIRFKNLHGHGGVYVDCRTKIPSNSHLVIGLAISRFIVHGPVKTLILTAVADVSRLAHHNSLRDLPVKGVDVKMCTNEWQIQVGFVNIRLQS